MEQDNKNNSYAYIALSMLILSAVFLGLAFTVMGVYSLVASAFLTIVGMSFINAQKRRNFVTWMRAIEIAIYVLFIADMALLLTGVVTPKK